MNIYNLIKSKLQQYFAANTDISNWSGSGLPGTGWITVYEEVDKKLLIEFQIKLEGDTLEVLDIQIINKIYEIKTLIADKICVIGIPVSDPDYSSLTIGKNLKFIRWSRRINQVGTSQTEKRYLATGTLIYQMFLSQHLETNIFGRI